MTGAAAGRYCPRCTGRLLLDARDGVDAPAAPEPAQPGSGLRVGEYELGPELGRGGMGVVYRGRHARLKRAVAVKVILASQFAGEIARKRFFAEAELAAQLDHPNIVPIYEVGEAVLGPFYAMKLVEGRTLAALMFKPEPPPDRPSDRRIATLLAKLARAVHHAHQRGVLHRDLKPGNILLDAQDEPHIADFGLARQLGADHSLSGSGSPVGTPAYMSPEQARGEKSVTTASDVWSLGAIFYHLLAGRPPFEGASAVEVLRAVGEEEPRRLGRRTDGRPLTTEGQGPNEAAPGLVDRDLETICLKCLQKEPAARYGSAAELADDLERWLRAEPILARPASACERLGLFVRRRPAVTALALLALLLGVSGLVGVLSQWQRAEREREAAQNRLLQLHLERAQRAVAEGDPVSTLPWLASALAAERPSSPRAESYRYFFANTLRECLFPQEIWFFDQGVGEIAFSADGRYLAAAAGRADLLVAELEGAGRRVVSTRVRGGGKQLAFTPDGTQLLNAQDGHTIDGVLNDGALKRFALPGVQPRTDLPVLPGMRSLQVSQDGRWLALATKDGSVEIRHASTGEPASAPFQCGGEVVHAEFNPAGTQLVTVARRRGTQVWEIPSGRPLAGSLNLGFRRARFSPDGRRLLLVEEREGAAHLHDAETLAPVGTAIRVGQWLNDAVFSPDGTRIATACADHAARVWDTRTGQPVTPPLVHGNEVRLLSFTSDGRWLATGGIDSSARVWDSATGKPVTPWLRHGGRLLALKLSPTGRHLLTGCSDGAARLWPLPDDVPRRRLLAGQPLPVWRTEFSPDGRVAFATGEGRGRVWRTTDWQPLAPEFQAGSVMDRVEFSPDGQRLLTGLRDGRVLVWKLDSAEPMARFAHQSQSGISAATWLPDSRRIFSTSREGDFALWDARDGRLLHACSFGFSNAYAVAASPDGKWLAAGAGERVALFDAATGARVWLHKLNGSEIRVLRFSPDCRWLASGDQGGRVWLLAAANGQPAAPAMQHAAHVRQIRFSPDGLRMATASDDLTVRLWRPRNGQPLTPPLKLTGGYGRVSFSPDGRWLVAADARSFQFWDSVSGVPLSLLQTSEEELTGGAFVDDDRFVSVTESGEWRDYRLESVDWPIARIMQAVALLAGQAVDAHGVFSVVPAAGTEGTPAHRQNSEAVWAWLRTRRQPSSP